MKKSIFIITLFSFLVFNCKEDNKTQAEEPSTETVIKQDIIPGNFAHTVYFWLKNPDNASDRDAFETSLKKFINQSPFITTKHIGVPANTSRGVIDTSYTYSLLLTFENKEQQDNYQEEVAHKQFIKESENLWSKVVVYDSENLLSE